VSLAILTIVEEASHSLGQHLTIVGVRDEVVSGATDTFVATQGAGGEAAEDLDNDMVYEASHCVPLVGVSSISSVCSRMRASLVMRSLKRKIIQQRSITEVHNSYQNATLTTINNFHGMTSSKFRVAAHRYI
jgi:hypothetical protein